MNSNKSRSLHGKRILITDVQNEFGKELQGAFRMEGAVVFVLVKEVSQIESIMKEFPDVSPILLDINAKDGGDEGYKLLSSMPTLDHIVNLNGDSALDIIAKAYGNWKIQEFGESKTKPLITKMKDSSALGLIFHSSVGNQNLMSKLKANLNPRYTDSATAQVSTSVRKSLKKFFTSDPTPTPTVVAPTPQSNLAQTIASNNDKATEFASLATSLAAGGKKGSTSPTPSDDNNANVNNGNSPKRTLSLRLRPKDQPLNSVSEKNERIRQSTLKICLKASKKWRDLLKNMEKHQLNELKQLDKNISKMKKREKGVLMSQNKDVNASTSVRANVLSADTANRIMASREARVDREVEKKTEKKRDEDTLRIAEEKQQRFEKETKKLYHKMVNKQIIEFNRIKVKYMV